MRYFGICIHLFVFIPSVITLQLKMSERQDCRFIRRKGDFMNNNQTSAVNNTANKTFTTKYMVELAAMIAIIIIMAFTPLGYIKLPGLTITFLTIPVACWCYNSWSCWWTYMWSYFRTYKPLSGSNWRLCIYICII